MFEVQKSPNTKTSFSIYVQITQLWYNMLTILDESGTVL